MEKMLEEIIKKNRLDKGSQKEKYKWIFMTQ